jgi:hypothetical protein
MSERSLVYIKNITGTLPLLTYKECFWKFGVELGVEKLIVNEPLVLKTLIFQIAY